MTALVVTTTAFSQFYVSLGTGYTMGMPSSNLGTKETDSKIENVYGTFGTGLNAKLNVGYFFNENLGFDLGLTYLMGSEQEVYSYSGSGGSETQKATATAIGLAPTLVYKWDNGLYGKFGFATKIGGKVDVDQYEKNIISSTMYSETNAKAEINGKMPLGFTGAMGYQFNLSDNLNLFLEMEYLGINVKRDKKTVTEYETKVYAGGSLIQTVTLAQLTAEQKETIYVDEITSSSPANYELTTMSPYSSFGFNIGIKYTFGGGK